MIYSVHISYRSSKMKTKLPLIVPIWSFVGYGLHMHQKKLNQKRKQESKIELIEETWIRELMSLRLTQQVCYNTTSCSVILLRPLVFSFASLTTSLQCSDQFIMHKYIINYDKQGKWWRYDEGQIDAICRL